MLPFIVLSTLILTSRLSSHKQLTLTSPSFNNGERIPKECSLANGNNSPELEWEDAPAETKSFALVMSDPDAAHEFTHWIAWNIPADEDGLDNGQSRSEDYLQGTNDFGNIGYDGPSPPKGTHRYFITLYALDKEINGLGKKSKRSDLKNAIKNSILEKDVIMGTYSNS